MAKKKTRKNSVKSARREWIEAIIIAFILALIIRTFLLQAFKIPSGSMIPTLRPGDRILVNKLFYGPKIPFLGARLPRLKELKRGEVIVFIYPPSAGKRNFESFKQYLNDETSGLLYRRMLSFFKDTRSKSYIKRLIGLPGEAVQIKNGDIYINDELVENSRIRANTYFNEGPYGGADRIVDIPDNSYYCLGDNSSSSRDSRYWGFVNERFLTGKAFLIYWPLNRMRIIR
ncbi:MAG: signal peptidase I [Candidatus Omnitrophica bacterium]|nr:signal peptidase I [Candidatus Omnitrophota bacterium]